MSGGRTVSPNNLADEHLFLDAKGATGAGTAMNVSDFRHITVYVATDGGADAALTVKCAGSIDSTEPTWASAASVSNEYSYIGMYDYEDATLTDGDTGFVVATADDTQMFTINTDGLIWVNFVVTARTAGEVTVKGRGFTNE